MDVFHFTPGHLRIDAGKAFARPFVVAVRDEVFCG